MENDWVTVKAASGILGVSHRHVLHLVRKSKLRAELQDAPVPYYLINRESVEAYKKAPKSKGGRPRKPPPATNLPVARPAADGHQEDKAAPPPGEIDYKANYWDLDPKSLEE